MSAFLPGAGVARVLKIATLAGEVKTLEVVHEDQDLGVFLPGSGVVMVLKIATLTGEKKIMEVSTWRASSGSRTGRPGRPTEETARKPRGVCPLVIRLSRSHTFQGTNLADLVENVATGG